MKYSYDLTHSEIILRDYPVYSSSDISDGALMMMGTTDPDSDADQGLTLVPAYSATDANSAIDAVGTIQEDVASGDMTATPAASTNEFAYAKIIINPFTVYQAQHSLGTSDDVALTSTSSTTVTISSLSDDIDGYWIYFPLTDDGVKGSLRYLRTSASGSAVMDSALSTAGDSSDTAVIITPELQYSNNLTSDSTKVGSSDCQSISGATNLRVLQAYIDRDQGLEPLKKADHEGLDNLDNVKGGNGPKFYVEIICRDHLFGVQE